MNKGKKSLTNIIAYALLGAIAFVMLKLAVPFPIATFLKFDLSDVIIAIGTFLFGPGPGIFMALIRVLLDLIIQGFSLPSIVGQLASFLASMSFVMPFYFISKNIDRSTSKKKRFLYPILGLVLGTLAMAIVLAVLNAFVLTPMYAVTSIPKVPSISSYAGLLSFTEKGYLGGLLHIPSMTTYIFGMIVPFNLLKGLINSVVVYLLFEVTLNNLKPFVEKNFK